MSGIHSLGLFFGKSLYFILFLPSHPAQTSDKRSSELSFYQISPFPSFTVLSPRRATSARLVIFSTRPFPPLLSSSHPAQTSYKHSSGLFFLPRPFTSASFTISISPLCPDKRQALVWAILSPDPSLSLPLPSHPAQTTACRSSGLSFHWTSHFCLTYHLIQPR
jgi:hypothetical protein